jgi:hypothetical protein
MMTTITLPICNLIHLWLRVMVMTVGGQPVKSRFVGGWDYAWLMGRQRKSLDWKTAYGQAAVMISTEQSFPPKILRTTWPWQQWQKRSYNKQIKEKSATVVFYDTVQYIISLFVPSWSVFNLTTAIGFWILVILNNKLYLYLYFCSKYTIVLVHIVLW